MGWGAGSSAAASSPMTPTARTPVAAWRRWGRRPASRSTPGPSCHTTPTRGPGRPPPGPDEVRGQGFFGDTAEEAEQLAKAFLGLLEPAN